MACSITEEELVVGKVIQHSHQICPKCQNGSMNLVELSTSVSFMFLPLWTKDEIEHALHCIKCGFTRKLELNGSSVKEDVSDRVIQTRALSDTIDRIQTEEEQKKYIIDLNSVVEGDDIAQGGMVVPGESVDAASIARKHITPYRPRSHQPQVVIADEVVPDHDYVTAHHVRAIPIVDEEEESIASNRPCCRYCGVPDTECDCGISSKRAFAI